MNEFNPHIHHRRSIRLKGYDYSQEGLYFITICVQDKLCLFGEIVGAILCDRPIIENNDRPIIENNDRPIIENNDRPIIGNDDRPIIGNDDRPNEIDNSNNFKMILNDAGRMIEKWYYELENKYPDKRCHEMVVMPNHIHFIIENIPSLDAHVPSSDAHVGAPLRGRPQNDVDPQNDESSYGINNKKYNATIGDAMDWFKTMTTNEYIRNVKRVATQGNPNSNDWLRFKGKLWQRNYYEHIIRDEQSYERIANYIINNPAKWNDDKFYNQNENE